MDRRLKTWTFRLFGCPIFTVQVQTEPLPLEERAEKLRNRLMSAAPPEPDWRKLADTMPDGAHVLKRKEK